MSGYTIAYLTTAFRNDMMNQAIWSGIKYAAKDSDINLFCFTGNSPNTGVKFEVHADSIYNLIDEKKIDGLIIWGGGTWASSDSDDVIKFYKNLYKYPIVNISLTIENFPSVVIDNYRGMYDACVHLIEHHKCRRMVFIKGPETHNEARLRFSAYRDVLNKFNLPFDEELIVPGVFEKKSGIEGIKILMDERRVDFDSLAGGSDLMAIGAMEELRSRGIKIPDTVKIVGFDDIDESRYHDIPLTTIKQPFFELGRIALGNLVIKLKNDQPEPITMVPPALIIRQSCGCRNPLIEKSAAVVKDLPLKTGAGQKNISIEKIISSVCTEIITQYNSYDVYRDLIGILSNAFYDDLIKNEEGVFLRTIGNELLERKNETDQFNIIISSIRNAVIPYLYNDPDLLIRSENLFHYARFFIGDFAKRMAIKENFVNSADDEILQDINQKLITTLKIDVFMNIIADELPKLGIKSCFLSLYDNPEASFEKARLMMAYVDNKRVDLDKEGFLFKTNEIIPVKFFPAADKINLIIQPLYFENEQLGFIVLKESLKNATVYESLRLQISIAVKGILLIREKEKLLGNLEKHARELQDTMDKLSHSNKELEQFSYAASHDLKEPLRKVSVFADRLKKHYIHMLDDQGRDYLDRMENAADRMRILIDNLLEYSRVTTKAKPFTKVNLAHTVRDILADLEILIEQKRAVMEIHDLPEIEADPSQMRQIFQNLISNALKFVKPGAAANIKISGSSNKINGRDYCTINVEDNGIGIDEKDFDKIFIIFNRLHGSSSYEGTGIGLAICKKVAERHRGSIKVESRLGEGSRFIITLPVRHENAIAAAGMS